MRTAATALLHQMATMKAREKSEERPVLHVEQADAGRTVEIVAEPKKRPTPPSSPGRD